MRLEALSAASWLGGAAGAEIALTVAASPTDRWIRNALKAAMLTLGDDARQLVDTGSFDADRLSVDTRQNVCPRAARGGQTQERPDAVEEVCDTRFMKTYEIGQKVFYEEGSCNTCHREHGKGVTGIYPPLVGSEWVTGDTDRLIKLTLHGIWGPIQVAGKQYEPAGGVPPMTAVGMMFTDEEIAAVLTYVRNSWGNDAAGDGAETWPVSGPRQPARGRRSTVLKS